MTTNVIASMWSFMVNISKFNLSVFMLSALCFLFCLMLLQSRASLYHSTSWTYYHFCTVSFILASTLSKRQSIIMQWVDYFSVMIKCKIFLTSFFLSFVSSSNLYPTLPQTISRMPLFLHLSYLLFHPSLCKSHILTSNPTESCLPSLSGWLRCIVARACWSRQSWLTGRVCS